MNPQNRLGGDEVPDEDPKALIQAFFAQAAADGKEQARFGEAALPAMRRLARAVYGHDNGQAQIVAACIASIYNGSEARPVRLDEIRGLDWSLQRDLLTVMVGTGHGPFTDEGIRHVFYEVGGDDAVAWLHWYTTGGPHRAALARIVEFIAQDSYCSTAGILRDALRSLFNGTTTLNIHRLTYVGELGPAMALVIEGVIGRDAGTITEKEIEDAFAAANISDALTSDKWPRSTKSADRSDRPKC